MLAVLKKSPLMNLAGREIARRRTSKGLTQEFLTARCQVLGWEVERGTLAKVEAGLRQITDWELWVLASALELTVTDILPDEDTCRTFLNARARPEDHQRRNDDGGRKRS